MTKQSLQQQNCEVQIYIYRFGEKKIRKKITEQQICNL